MQFVALMRVFMQSVASMRVCIGSSRALAGGTWSIQQDVEMAMRREEILATAPHRAWGPREGPVLDNTLDETDITPS